MASPDHVAMHSVSDEDPLELAIFELLREHCGEEVGGAKSINASRALLTLLKVAAQLLAPYPDKRRAEWISAFRSGATHLNRRIHTEYEKRAGSVPQ